MQRQLPIYRRTTLQHVERWELRLVRFTNCYIPAQCAVHILKSVLVGFTDVLQSHCVQWWSSEVSCC